MGLQTSSQPGDVLVFCVEHRRSCEAEYKAVVVKRSLLVRDDVNLLSYNEVLDRIVSRSFKRFHNDSDNCGLRDIVSTGLAIGIGAGDQAGD